MKKTLRHDRSYDEAMSIKHPNPQPDVEPPVKTSKKKGYSNHIGKRNGCPTAITCLTGIC